MRRTLAGTLAPEPVQPSRRSSLARRSLVSAVALIGLVPSSSHARATVDFIPVPDGWRYSLREPYPGVEVLRFARGNQRISVVAVSPTAPVSIEHRLAHEELDRRERTARPTRICRRLDCIAAINGAFFDRSSGLPFSGIISGGELIRSVTSNRPHVSIDAGVSLDQTTPPVQLVMYSQNVLDPFGAPSETRLTLRGVNRPRGKQGIAVYTRRWGSMTPGRYGREILLRAVGDPSITVGTQSVFEAVELRRAGGYLRSDEIVISGTGEGAKQLEEIWRRVRSGEVNPVVALDIGTGPSTLIGTRPLLIRDGRVLVRNSSWFSRARHPRSILASRADGTILFVVIDGRHEKRRGMSLPDAAQFLRSIGAVNAANLDGGGSSAMVVEGRLHSRPAFGERKVSTALVVLPAPPAA